MAEKVIKIREKTKIDTSDNWDNSTLILRKGEFAINEDSGELRYGDGTHTYKDSPSIVSLGNVPNVTTNNQTPTFTQASTRTNIVSGEKLSTIFSKIKKFFADLKTVAFTGNIEDLVTKSHASTSDIYGKATGVDYGHVMLSDSTSSNSGDNKGIAATPSAVKAAYDKASAATKSADIVIAAYDSSDEWKASADYICDGIDDQIEINEAITDIYNNSISGGKILLSTGTFYITSYINLIGTEKALYIQGMGDSTRVCTAAYIGNSGPYSGTAIFYGLNEGSSVVLISDICVCNNNMYANYVLYGGYKSAELNNVTLKSAYSVPSSLGYTAKTFTYSDYPGWFSNLGIYMSGEFFKLNNCTLFTDYSVTAAIMGGWNIDKLYIRGSGDYLFNIYNHDSIVDILHQSADLGAITINVSGDGNKVIQNPNVTINNSGTNNIIS